MAEIEPMNRSQEVLHDLLFVRELLSAKRVAWRLHKARNYLSDICRRDRVDFLAVFNEVLREAEASATNNPPLMLAIANPIATLLVEGTNWHLEYNPAPPQTHAGYVQLCEQTGNLMEDLGGAIKAIARIEADGEYDERDDADIAECQQKLSLLVQRCHALRTELSIRRNARTCS